MAGEGVSEFVSKQLSDIAGQLGQMSSSIEALREDMRDESSTAKQYRDHISQRVDNIAERMGKAEEAITKTKKLLDESVMPLVRTNENRRLQISGALKVWGFVIIIATSIGTVFWSRLLNFVLYMMNGGPP